MRLRLMNQQMQAFQTSLRAMSDLCPWKNKTFGSVDPWGGDATGAADVYSRPGEVVEAERTLDMIGELFDTLAAAKNKTRIKGYLGQIKVNVAVFIEQLDEYVAKTKK